MNIEFWNICGGLHEQQKQREVSSFISNNSIDIFGLLETKLNNSTYDVFIKSNLRDWNFVDKFCTARNGRIILVWNPARLVVDIVSVEAQVIHAKVECRVSGNRFHLVTCYGRNQLQERRELWDSLIEH